jgi:hypothetical protein
MCVCVNIIKYVILYKLCPIQLWMEMVYQSELILSISDLYDVSITCGPSLRAMYDVLIFVTHVLEVSVWLTCCHMSLAHVLDILKYQTKSVKRRDRAGGLSAQALVYSYMRFVCGPPRNPHAHGPPK